jgi:hypothetical protein
MMRIPTRSDDELLLTWIKRRCKGHPSSVIARAFGVSQERIRTATSRVMQADMNESGESVDAQYWDPRPGSRA